ELRTLERHLAGEYYRSLVGRRVDVLVEGAHPQRPGYVLATSCRYAPVTFAAHTAALVGRRVPVRAVAVAGGVIVGEPEADPSATTVARDGAADAANGFFSRIPLPLAGSACYL